MKNRNTIQFTTIIIILSMLTVSVEFALLHLLNMDFYAALISSGIVLIVTLVLLWTSRQYETVFIYLLLNVLLSSILAGYRFWELQYFYYSTSNLDLWMILINYFIPVIVCLFYSLLGSNSQPGDYSRFIRSTSILFLVYFGAIFAYIQFVPHPGTIWSTSRTNYIPFYTAAGYIESLIYQDYSLKDVLPHLLLPILLYVPIGYFIALWLKHSHRILRIVFLILIPSLTEGIQLLLHSDALNVDHIIYAFLGGIIGELILFLINGLFLLIKGSEFAESDQRTSYNLRF